MRPGFFEGCADYRLIRIATAESGRALLVALASMLYFSNSVAAEPRMLVIGDSNGPPFTNAERTGFFDIVAAEAFRRVGLDLRVVRLPAERGLLLANNGVEDGELGRIAGLERQYSNLVRVPEKLLDRHYVAFSKDSSIPAGVEAIRGRAVGYIRGWKIYESALAGAKDVIAADDAEQLFRLLQLDRIEVALYARVMGLEHIRKYRIKHVRVLDPSIYIREVFIYLHKRHAGQVPALAAALRAMKQDGTYQRAYEEKLSPYFGSGPR